MEGILTFGQCVPFPGAPLAYFNDGEGRGGGCPSDFFWPTKDTRIFWVMEKNRQIFLGCKKLKVQLKDFLGMLKRVVIFWVDKFCSCDFLGYKI